MEMKSSLVTLQPGMYILRHPKGGLPALSIARAPGGTGRYEILATPRTQGSVLRDGSDCIVMRVFEGPVEILVTAYVAHVGIAAPALRVDQIGLDAEPAAAPASPVAAPATATRKPIEIAAQGISIIGHIERLGDVVVSEGKPLGQPGSDLRLEGFQVMWPDKPAGVDLAYGLTVEGAEPGPMVATGQFCGTRNMARRITEVTFALTGAQANQFQLEGLAHFSGGFRAPIASGVALSGPSGLEHLTSISLRTVAVPPGSKNTVNPWSASPQTQVFKAKTTAPAKAAPAKTVAAKAVAVKPAPAKAAPAKAATSKTKTAKKTA